jgi:hypothetical protein
MSDPRWRVGHHLGRTVYLDDELVGLMDTPELGALVVGALNGPVIDREALLSLLDDYAVGRHVPEDAAQHRAFIADAVLALLNGGAS